MKLPEIVWLAVVFVCSISLADDPASLKANRQDVFEFVEKPVVSRSGDVVTISFASKGWCDVAIAIEDGQGRIVRHLAAGLLGPNAPAPLVKNSLRQSVAWDCKDDLDEYVRDMAGHTVRVSLGLKPVFERTLFWSPYKRGGRSTLLVRAAPEGVYVFDAGNHPQVRLFDHDGNYLRTVYPLPQARVDKLDGIHRLITPPDERPMPVKWGTHQTSFLTYEYEELTLNWPAAGQTGGDACGNPAMDVRDRVLFLARKRLNRVPAEDRTVATLKQHGPPLTYPVSIGGVHTFVGGIYQISPRSMAIAPDGKTAYLAGYLWRNPWREGSLNGVAKVDLFGNDPPTVVLGSFDNKKPAPPPQNFHAATSVAVDSRGRLYVSDYMNDRVQVFTPDGKLVRSIPITRPALVRLNPKTDEIFVFTWSVASSYDDTYAFKGKPMLTWLGTVEDPKVKAAWPIDVPAGWTNPDADVDVHGQQLTIWLSLGSKEGDYWTRPHIRLFTVDGEKLALKLDFREQARKDVIQVRPPHMSRQRLFVNPATGLLHVGEHHQPSPEASKSFQDLVKIDPATGRIRMLPIPFDAEDMAFDIAGNACLRTHDLLVRYFTGTEPWREMPFDYGEERPDVYYNSSVGKHARVVSGVPFVGQKGTMFHLGGMAVSPKGSIAVVVWNMEKYEKRTDDKSVFAASGGKKYTPKLFPGRTRSQEIHVFDRHGKLLYEDALPGVGLCSGIAMDRDDNIYALIAGTPTIAGRPWPNPIAATWIKFAPKACRILSTGAVLEMDKSERPTRPPDILNGVHIGTAWIEGAAWRYPGAGFEGKLAKCSCASNSRPALDYYARSFLPEVDRYRVAVLDSNGNVILRLGRYGNVDESPPAIAAGGPAGTQPAGSGEPVFMHPEFLAVHTDNRLFVADPGNARIVSVKLGYHSSESVAFRNE